MQRCCITLLLQFIKLLLMSTHLRSLRSSNAWFLTVCFLSAAAAGRSLCWELITCEHVSMSAAGESSGSTWTWSQKHRATLGSRLFIIDTNLMNPWMNELSVTVEASLVQIESSTAHTTDSADTSTRMKAVGASTKHTRRSRHGRPGKNKW